ncbi:hypothetical protein ACHWQZ_G013311 [Mnemiopsis leidyi]
MYGFVFDAIRLGCFKDFNNKTWQDISKDSGCSGEFDYSVDYDSDIFYRLADDATTKMKYTRSAVLQMFGRWYIAFIWDKWNMGMIGRTPGEFFRNWSDFFEYKSQEYPLFIHDRFKVVSEDNEGMTLEYKTVHEDLTLFCLGMVEYVIIKRYNVPKENLQITTKVGTLSEEEGQKKTKFNKSTYKIKFDNQRFNSMANRGRNLGKFPNEVSDRFRPSQMLNNFPFFVHFDRNMKILHVGKQLKKSYPKLLGQSLDSLFDLKQPTHGHLSYDYIIRNLHIFYVLGMSKTSTAELEYDTPLVLQGQMVTGMVDKSVLFLCYPAVGCFLSRKNAFYVGDLPPGPLKHTVIALICLKNSLVEHSLDLEKENMRYRESCLEAAAKEAELSDNLLNQLMPPHIHKAVRVGRPYGESCELYNNATVLLSDMVGFTSICSQISPMDVARMLNAMYMTFDSLISNRKSVYKVETIGDGYMVVVGIPNTQERHAEYAADMAIDMLAGLKKVELPFLEGKMAVKLGINSGPIVAGVMGWKVPRYGVFGDTVNVVNVLESTSKANRIHISESTFKLLNSTGKFVMKPRRSNSLIDRTDINQKLMNFISRTYWLCGRRTSDTNPFENEEAEDEALPVAVAKQPVTKTKKTTVPTDMGLDVMVDPESSSVISAEGVRSVEERWKIVVEKIRKFEKESKICSIC